MKLKIIVFIILLNLLASCHGQSKTQPDSAENLNTLIAAGDTVKELGKSIMVIHQDKKIFIGLGAGKQVCIDMVGRH